MSFQENSNSSNSSRWGSKEEINLVRIWQAELRLSPRVNM